MSSPVADAAAILPGDLSNYHLCLIIPVLCIAIACVSISARNARRKLPPGPRPLPIIGNVHQMVGRRPLEILGEWHAKYGPIVSFFNGSTPVLSIASHDIAHQLLNKRSQAYSSRPRFLVPSQLMTDGMATLLIPNGKKWHNQHRIIAPLLDSRALKQYRTIEDMESKQTLVELLSMQDFDKSISRYTASVVLSLAYGMRLPNPETDMPERLIQLNRNIFEAIAGTYETIVELFPILDNLPGCLAPWRKTSASVERHTTAFHMEHLEIAKASPSWNWVKEAMQSKPGAQVSEKELAYVVGTLQQGAFEAPLAAIRVVIKAMILFPDCLEKAHEELDRVVGADRLPAFDDLANLPYVNATVSEALRWQPPAPIVPPHATSEEDEWMGYRFAKGTVILPNGAAMGRDPAVFSDPHRFDPERWIKNPNLPYSPFGFGRRTCPGGGLAMNLISILVARMMWGFDMTYLYRDGKAVDVDPLGDNFAFAALTSPFEASLTVRSPEKRAVIEREWAAAEKDTDQILQEIGASKPS